MWNYEHAKEIKSAIQWKAIIRIILCQKSILGVINCNQIFVEKCQYILIIIE